MDNRDITSQPRGLMDKAPAYGAGDCGFKSRRGCYFCKNYERSNFILINTTIILLLYNGNKILHIDPNLTPLNTNNIDNN